MAKKKTTKKKKKKTSAARKPAARSKARTSKKTKKKTARSAKKGAAKKTTAKKSTSKKKTAAKRASTNKTRTKKKKTTKKKTATTKKSVKKVAKTASGKRSGADGASKRSKTAPGPMPDADGYVIINGRRVRMMSPSSGNLPNRKVAARAAQAAVPQEKTVKNKPIKSKLNRRQLEQFRELLILKRAELIGDLSALEEQALQSGGGNISHMPIHMADIGTDTYDQDFMLGLAETERRALREIDEALMRIADGTYGICQLTGKPIPLARLKAKPQAKYTVEAARLIESGLGG